MESPRWLQMSPRINKIGAATTRTMMRRMVKISAGFGEARRARPPPQHMVLASRVKHSTHTTTFLPVSKCNNSRNSRSTTYDNDPAPKATQIQMPHRIARKANSDRVALHRVRYLHTPTRVGPGTRTTSHTQPLRTEARTRRTKRYSGVDWKVSCEGRRSMSAAAAAVCPHMARTTTLSRAVGT